MSARTAKKPARKPATTKPAAPTSPTLSPTVEIIAAMSTAQGSNLFDELLPLAEAQLPALIDSGLEIAKVSTLAEEIVRKAYDGGDRDLRLLEGLQLADHPGIPFETREAIGTICFQQAEAGFALGLALGLRLASK